MDSCHAVFQRAAQTLEWITPQNWLLDIALDHLTLGRAVLYEAILESCRRRGDESQILFDDIQKRIKSSPDIQTAHHELDTAVTGFRRSGYMDYIPLGFLTRAWLRFLTGARTGPDSAQADLDEAWEIAERGPMKLFLTDIHLHRARLFFREPVYPWNKNLDGTPRGPQDDLAAAETLINKCGYHRRDEELADAKRAILA